MLSMLKNFFILSMLVNLGKILYKIDVIEENSQNRSKKERQFNWANNNEINYENKKKKSTPIPTYQQSNQLASLSKGKQ